MSDPTVYAFAPPPRPTGWRRRPCGRGRRGSPRRRTAPPSTCGWRRRASSRRHVPRRRAPANAARRSGVPAAAADRWTLGRVAAPGAGEQQRGRPIAGGPLDGLHDAGDRAPVTPSRVEVRRRRGHARRRPGAARPSPPCVGDRGRLGDRELLRARGSRTGRGRVRKRWVPPSGRGWPRVRARTKSAPGSRRCPFG